LVTEADAVGRPLTLKTILPPRNFEFENKLWKFFITTAGTPPGVVSRYVIPATFNGMTNPPQNVWRSYSAACEDGGRMVSTPSASVAEIVVRTISRASCEGHGRPRCMVARLSHITTSPLRHWCR
jgi:hypothetical protein